MSHEEALLLRWAEVAWGVALAVALLAGVRALPVAWRMLRHGPWAERATLLAVAVAWLLRPGGVVAGGDALACVPVRIDGGTRGVGDPAAGGRRWRGCRRVPLSIKVLKQLVFPKASRRNG
jgi:hypothetical protein